ncbi:MAG: hypothetical protein KDA24_18135 [Deltaproteobacteria bacterium]|nr:hypothetical protein [Deltaproteobacteria bacterium]
MTLRLAPLFALVALLSGCADQTVITDHSGPLALRVTFPSSPGGETEETALPFAVDDFEVNIRVEALGYDKEPMTDWSGIVSIRATPAQLLSAPFVTVTNGVADATVTLTRGYGQVRIWASDEGTDETPGSFATGVAPTLHFRFPTIAQVQETESTITSLMEHTYVHIRGWDLDLPDPRDMRVTAVTNDGFYVTDLSEPFGSYNSMFAFTFSRPEGIEKGMRLARLSGIVEEFLGFTEMGFPDWEVVDAPGEPEPPILASDIVCDSPEMEKWESTVVTVGALESDFRGGGECADYVEFGQWPALLLDRRGYPVQCAGGDARISVVNINTVPSFSFPECENFSPPATRELSSLTGILRHNRYASPSWILDVRDCRDFPESARPADCEQQLANPLSGPRKAPQWAYRDIPACEGHLTHR